jgi:hypothetical protein
MLQYWIYAIMKNELWSVLINNAIVRRTQTLKNYCPESIVENKYKS